MSIARVTAASQAEYGSDDDGWSMPKEAKLVGHKLGQIRDGKARLQAMFRAKAVEKGKDPETAQVPERAQTNFTDPESR
ncbi:MAG TPA: hypothetical protein VJB57_10490, partial [Dehalococcoidia bacterium]|nr:hypothetical protein [Dehalococcoidia bacterium]